MSSKVVVVGAGVGGLAAAIDLARAGCHVTIFEKEHNIGGKVGYVDLAGARIDVGPTVLTMKWVFDALFASVGRRLDDHVTLHRDDVLARHAWPDGARLDLFADEARSHRAVSEAFGAAEAEAYRRFLAHAKTIYDTIEGPFLRSQRPDWKQGMRDVRTLGLGALLRVDALRSMAACLAQTFHTPNLRQLFGRYATYCGSSPFDAPSTYNLIAHVESLGVHRVEGGMRALADALGQLARDLGVEFQLGAGVERIQVVHGVAREVVVEGGQVRAADAIIFNGDVATLRAGHLGPGVVDAVRAALDPAERSFSAITWATVARADGFALAHHNVFFAQDGPGEFRALTQSLRVPTDPTVYLCAQARGDTASSGGDEPGDEPGDERGDEPGDERGDEPMLLVVNAPPTGGDPSQWNDEVLRQCERSAFSALARCGLKLTPRALSTTTPVDFERRFPATGGGLYGTRAAGAFAALTRPGARSRVQGLYLAGGSVHPGPGVPMAALSGRLAASRVLEDLASTRRSPRAAISGITSTS